MEKEVELIENIDISIRLKNVLRRMNVLTIDDLRNTPFNEIVHQRNIGKKTYEELKTLFVNYEIPIGKQYSDSFLLAISDYPVELLGLSEKALNAVHKKGIKTLDELLSLDLLIDHDGIRSNYVQEIIEQEKKWLNENQLVDLESNDMIDENFNNLIGDLYDMLSSLFIISIGEIANILKNNNLSDENLSCNLFFNFIKTNEMRIKLKSLFYDFTNGENIVKKDVFNNYIKNKFDESYSFLLLDYYENNILNSIDEYYIPKVDCAKKLLDEFAEDNLVDIRFEILYERIVNGERLQEIGDKYSLTRERIRQILKSVINIYLPYAFEDCFSIPYQYFNFSKELFLGVFSDKADSTAFNYLLCKYKKGKINLNRDTILNYHGPFKEKILEFLDEEEKKYKSKTNLVYATLLNLNKSISLEEFEIEYYNFLRKENYDTNKYHINIRTVINHLRNSKYVVFDKNNKMRFVSIDYKELTNLIDFSLYNNLVISSELLYARYEEYMEYFDIRDGYELFYALKNAKREIESFDLNVNFRRVPTIVIGNGNEETQTKKLLQEISPIKVSDYYSIYEKRFGVKKASAEGNLYKYLTNYLVNGYYTIDPVLINPVDVSNIKEKLSKKNIWFVDELETIIRNNCIYTGIDCINHAALLQIGFNFLDAGYAISTRYKNVFEFFDSEVFNSDIVDLNKVDKHIISLSMFGSYLDDIKRNLKYIEVDKRIFMSLNYFLKKYDLTKNALIMIQSELLNIANDKYFNSSSVLEKINPNKILTPKIIQDLKDNKWMTNCLMRQKEGIVSLNLSTTLILSRSSEQLNIPYICLWISENEGKKSLYDLTVRFNGIFDANISKEKISEKIKSKDMWDQIISDSFENYINDLLETSTDDDLFVEEFY